MSSGVRLLVARSLRVRPLRALLTALAVALGTAVVVGVQLTESALRGQATASSALRAGASQLDVRALSSGLDASQVGTVASIPGVTASAALEEKRVAIRVAPTDVDAVTATLVATDAEGRAALRPVSLLEGRLPRPGSTSEVAIDAGVADALGVATGHAPGIGDAVRLTTVTGPDRYTVVGITSGTSGGPAFTRSAAFVSEAAAHGSLSQGLKTPLVALALAPGVTPAQVEGEVAGRLGPVVTTTDPRAEGVDPVGQLHPLLVLAVVLSLCVGAGVTANSVALATLERRRDIGLLRAAGATRRQVTGALLGEAALVSTAGALAGLGLGVALGGALVRAFASSDLSVPAPVPGVATAVAALAAGIGSAVAGAAVPALGAARTRPLDALRARPSGDRERLPMPLLVAVPVLAAAGVAAVAVAGPAATAAGAFLLLAAVVLALPVAVPHLVRLLAALSTWLLPGARIAAATLGRRRNRTALTLGGLCVAVAAAVATSGLSEGALASGDGWVGDLFSGNVVLVSPATAPDVVATQVAADENVTVSRLRFLSAPVDGELLGVTAIDVGPYRDRGGLDILDGDRTAALADIDNGSAVIAPRSLAGAAGWQVGTTVQIGSATNRAGPVLLRVGAIAAHTFPAGDGRESLVIGRAAAERFFGSQAAGFDDLDVSAGGSVGAVEAAAARYGLQAQTIDDLRAAARRALGHTLDILSALAWVAVTAAMLAVATTLAVNVRQGRRELALLRAVGMARREALRLLVAEAVLLGVAGTILGVAAGLLLDPLLVRAASSATFDPQFAVPWATIAAAGVTVVGGSAAAVLAPARAAVRVSVAHELRHE